jgi:hypothetical protein
VIKLKCKTEENCIETGKVESEEYRSSIYDLPFVNIFLDASFKNENLPARMKKALKHLIELNGGKLINEVF